MSSGGDVVVAAPPKRLRLFPFAASEAPLSRQFWIFFTAAFFFDFGFSIYFYFINLYLSGLGFRESDLGFFSGALTLGSVAATVPVAYCARRFDLRPLLLVCFVAAPILGTVRLFAAQRSLQIALAFLAGMAMCLWAVCFSPVLARITTPGNRPLAFSLVFSAGIGSSAFGGLLCGYIPGWLASSGMHMTEVQVRRGILVCACLFAAVGIVAVLRLRLPRMEDAALRKTRWRLHPYLRRFLPAMALWSTVTAAFVPFAAVYFSRSLGVSLPHIAYIFSASQMLQLAAGLAAPFLFRAAGTLSGVVYTQIATAAGMAVMAAVSDARIAVLLYLGFTATQWMNSPGIYSLLMSSVPEHEQTSASALTNLCNSILQAGGTALTGMAITHLGYPKVITVLACLALTSGLVFRILLAGSRETTPVAGMHG